MQNRTRRARPPSGKAHLARLAAIRGQIRTHGSRRERWRRRMSKPSIVFAHGLWADGSCYAKVIPPLIADGYEVISTQNHLNTVADDAAAVRTSLGRAHGPVVLVGHSYGGTVITAGGADDRVKALVYICAFAPEDGEPTQVDQAKFPQTAVFQHIEATDGRLFLRPSGIPEFAGDLPEAEQKLIWATQMAPLADLFT